MSDVTGNNGPTGPRIIRRFSVYWTAGAEGHTFTLAPEDLLIDESQPPEKHQGPWDPIVTIIKQVEGDLQQDVQTIYLRDAAWTRYMEYVEKEKKVEVAEGKERAEFRDDRGAGGQGQGQGQGQTRPKIGVGNKPAVLPRG